MELYTHIGRELSDKNPSESAALLRTTHPLAAESSKAETVKCIEWNPREHSVRMGPGTFSVTFNMVVSTSWGCFGLQLKCSCKWVHSYIVESEFSLFFGSHYL